MKLRAPALRPDEHAPEDDGSARRLLLDLFRAGLRAVDSERQVARALCADDAPGVAVIALGKAGAAMMRGAAEAFGARLTQGFVVTDEHNAAAFPLPPAIGLAVGDHPVPGVRSLAAGAALLKFLDALPAGLAVRVLVSGGASSLVEHPLPGVTLAHLQALNVWAHRHDVPITTLNALRRRLSALKGGRLAARLHGRDARALVLSDVPGDDPRVVGSGLVAAPPAEAALPPDLPGSLADLFAPRETPPSATLPVTLVGCLTDAIDAIEARASTLGLRVMRWPSRLDGAAEAVGATVAKGLLGADVDVVVAGGETTVVLPEEAGVGGRCQHLALSAALALEGHAGVWLLAAGTDGLDGVGTDAGALVDGASVERARLMEQEPAEALRRADAGRCLAASGDLLNTGATGTNVGDLVIGLRGSALAALAGAA